MDLPNQELQDPNNKSQQTTNAKEPLRLTSPAPITDGGRRYNKLYKVLAPIGAVLFVFIGGLHLGSIFVGALFGIIIAWVLKEAMLNGAWKALRKQPFALDNKVPYDKLIEKLIPALTPLGMIIEKNTSGEPTITYKKMIYDVTYGEDNTFTIWWRKSPLRAFFEIRTDTSNYRETVVAMGIIGYHVQQICSNKTEDVNQ